MTRTGVLLLLIYLTVQLTWLLASPRSIPSALIGLAVLALLIFWLFRTGTRPYRAWGVIGLGIGFAIATTPCWLARHFPAQDYGSAAAEEARAVMKLKRIQSVESRYHARFHRYGKPLEIKDEAGIDATSGSEGTVMPYRVQLVLSAERYRIVAVARNQKEPYSCWIGCPFFNSFYGDESGILRVDCHCRQANARSARADRVAGRPIVF